jgi:signal transduction histidine kinase
VLENLLGNAWKFTSTRESARIEIAGGEHDGRSEFVVRDDGVGFDMQHAGQLFKPFQRLHRADEFPGTGIGLASVKRIISRHGGQISAHGEVGRGATFTFILEPDPDAA